MEISPAVGAPRTGDPITAKWAADLSAAVNSSANPAANVGDVSSPNGKAERERIPAFPDVGNDPHPLPFTVRLVRDTSTGYDHAYCFLPSLPTTMRGFSYVSLYGEFTTAASDQTMGTAANGWVDLGVVAQGTRTWLILYFTEPDASAVRPFNTYKWKLALVTGNSSGPSLPADAWSLSPIVVIALFHDLADGTTPVNRDARGFFQIHNGFVSVGTMAWVPFGNETQNYCDGIGDRNNNAMLGFGSSEVTVYPDLNVNGAFKINNIPYHATQIEDRNGNTYTVLAE